jgi:hypothetical protein
MVLRMCNLFFLEIFFSIKEQNQKDPEFPVQHTRGKLKLKQKEKNFKKFYFSGCEKDSRKGTHIEKKNKRKSSKLFIKLMKSFVK